MNINITVLQVSKETKPTTKGSYQQLTVDFKNLSSGKVESKKLMSFASKEAFDALVDAKSGATYTVVAEKNEKSGYWDWVAVSQAAPGSEPTSRGEVTKTAAGFTPVKSTYETPAERALKQVFIIKQSSLTAALKFAELNKEKPTVEGLLTLAQQFTDWVVSKEGAKTETLTNMDDDVPF